MKRILILAFAAISIGASAQWKQGDVPPSSRRGGSAPREIDKADVTVYYAFNASDIKDEATYIDLGWLQVGKHVTKYASYFVAHSDSTYKPTLIQSGAASGYAHRAFGGKYPTRWSEYQFDEIYIKDGQLTEYAIMPMNLDHACCQYTEPMPKQQWMLKDEQQTIHGYRCQRATCHWRGRDYEAWFTTEVPIQRGPWKFGGLPGLIVKISDSKKEYNFELVKLERTPRPIMQYNFSRFHKVKRQDMLRLQKRINVNWVRVLSPEAGNQFPDHPFSPMELE
ncbi:MAG: GLPGLI family protein [Bacteroidaceae bacterium]|nr:GLPGLI family protein [Bacteroidaceae bacterium]